MAGDNIDWNAHEGWHDDVAHNFALGVLEDRAYSAPRQGSNGSAGLESLPGLDLQFCSAQVPLDNANRANDTASIVNVATGGRRANNPFFNPGSGALGVVTDFDVSPLTVAGWINDVWSRVGALNNALTGQRPADFQAISGPNGRPIVIGMPQSYWQSNPSANLRINGRNESITMDLPNFRGSAVTLVTNGHQVMAIDPRNRQIWQLQENTLFGYRTGFSWTEIRR